MADTDKGYKIIGISMYTRDIDDLTNKVAELKRLGWRGANKSHLIRIALAQLTPEQLQTIAAQQLALSGMHAPDGATP